MRPWRGDRAALIAAVLAAALIGAPVARADDLPEPPPVGDPQCVERYCACDGGVPHPCDFDCAALCDPSSSGSSSPSSSSGDTPRDPADAPIVKAFVGLVVVATFAIAVAIAPAHMWSVVADVQSADDARQGWDDYASDRDQRARDGEHLDRLEQDLRGAVAIADRAPIAQLPSTYVPVSRAPTVDRWAPAGYCSKLVQDNDAMLAAADAEATRQGYSFLPAPPDVPGALTGAARDAVVHHAGPADLAAQRHQMAATYDAATEWESFAKAIEICVAKPDLEANECLNALLAADLPAGAKSWLGKVIGDDTTDAIERVRSAAGPYRRFVEGLRHSIEKQGLTAAKCGASR